VEEGKETQPENDSARLLALKMEGGSHEPSNGGDLLKPERGRK
jgi:hypothetical protein